jgi:hypothetical protein
VFLQGDRRQSGTPSDGVVARRQIAEVLVRSLTSDAALRKTLELVAESGPEEEDLDPMFAALDADAIGALDVPMTPQTCRWIKNLGGCSRISTTSSATLRATSAALEGYTLRGDDSEHRQVAKVAFSHLSIRFLNSD